MGWIITIIIGLIGGLAVGFQGPFINGMGSRVGVISSSFILHLSGALISAVILVLVRGERISEWRGVPWYMLLSGGLGVILVITLNYTIPRLGVLPATMLLIAGQLMLGMLIDHFGWFGTTVRPIDLQRVLGVLLLLAAGYLITYQPSS